MQAPFVTSPLRMCSGAFHTDPAVFVQSQQVPLPVSYAVSYNMFSAACTPCIRFPVHNTICHIDLSLGVALCVLRSH